jgi:hypothetical protein
MGHRGAAALALLRAAAQARHLGRRACLVDEDQPGRIEVELTIEPVLSASLDVRTFLLGRMCGLFYK